MKHHLAKLLSGFLAVCLLAGSALAAEITPSVSSLQLEKDQATFSFDIKLHVDEAFAGAEFGLKPSASDVSLSESIDIDGDGNSLSLMDIIAEDDDMAERVSDSETCKIVRKCVESALSPREANIIRLRYGLDGAPPLTQRETAERCGISRSYVSRIEKRALQKLREALGEDV